MNINFIKIEKSTGKILTTFVDKVHGTYVPEVYQEVEKEIALSNDKTQIVKAKELVKEAYFDISNLDLSDCIEVDEATYRDILDKDYNHYDSETQTWSKKDFRTDEEILKQTKQVAINKVNSDVRTLILSGFSSSALGSEHKYQSDETDQLNLIGAVTSGIDQPFKCSDDNGITWLWKIHTIEQLQTVLKDGALYKNKLLEDASDLKNQIQSCTTVEEVEAIEI